MTNTATYPGTSKKRPRTRNAITFICYIHHVAYVTFDFVFVIGKVSQICGFNIRNPRSTTEVVKRLRVYVLDIVTTSPDAALYKI